MLKFFRLPFAVSGDKTAIPDAADPSGNVSYTQGFTAAYSLLKTDPLSKRVPRLQTNEVFYDITNAIAELQSQGVPDFIDTTLNGGTAYSYSANAVVRYSGDLYLSLAGSNTATPADATKWALLPTASRLQHATVTAAVAGGTADALTATFVPAIAALPTAPGTLSVLVRAGSANTTTTPTFSPDGLTAKIIVKGNNLALAAGDIAGAGHWLALDYDATLDRWVLQNPATGITSATYTGRLLSVSVITSSGTWTRPAGCTQVVVEVQAPGGGSGGTSTTGGGQYSLGGPGGAGGYSRKFITSPGATETVTIGAAGAAGGVGTNGGTGGTTSFGAHASATGGTGGGSAGANSAAQIIGGGTGGIGSGGDINTTGGSRGPSLAIPGSSVYTGLEGANAVLGGGGQYGVDATPPVCSGYGGGAGGQVLRASLSGLVGRAGAPGVVIVWEYS